MKVSELTGHPENSKIYQDTDLTDLKNSLSIYGQLEPIVITKSKRIISGHRRFAAIKSLSGMSVTFDILKLIMKSFPLLNTIDTDKRQPKIF